MNALLLLDIQYDFLPGGSLAVPDGDKVILSANALMPHFEHVLATQDWHPADHRSFATNHKNAEPGDVITLDGLEQVLWPDHCVQNTHGARLSDDLEKVYIETVVRKGTDPMIDSYSGFFDNGHRKKTRLDSELKRLHVTDLYIMGLTTDYCVKYTALDACNLGYNTYLIIDGCRGIDLNPGDVEAAIEIMKKSGVSVLSSDSVIDSCSTK